MTLGQTQHSVSLRATSVAVTFVFLFGTVAFLLAPPDTVERPVVGLQVGGSIQGHFTWALDYATRRQCTRAVWGLPQDLSALPTPRASWGGAGSGSATNSGWKHDKEKSLVLFVVVLVSFRAHPVRQCKTDLRGGVAGPVRDVEVPPGQPDRVPAPSRFTTAMGPVPGPL